MEVLLSILIPSIPERLQLLTPLVTKLQQQIGDKPVELMVMMDNRKQPLGTKRNTMMATCLGKHLTHLDDDDDVADDYVDAILGRLVEAPSVDVLSFNSQTDLGDGMPFVVKASLAYENQQTNIEERDIEVEVPAVPEDADGKGCDAYTKTEKQQYRPDITRLPWHWCVWRSELARQGKFPVEFMGEDWVWIQQVVPLCKTETRINRTLHRYFYNKNVSLS